uniref:Plectin isoform X3 n=1 Tax=Petromyzon marinus TaxID=7757 RepID=A0AAJ7TCV4_PETMA|nr:plectin isoform X3 [Petromyzon marinus]
MAFSNSPGLLENDVFEDAVFRGATTDTFVVVSQTPERLSVASPSSVSSSSSSLCNREWRAADLTGGGSLASLMCCTDERDRVQKKTFTKWVNKHLMKHWKKEVRKHVNDMYEDLRDGHNLISLLEVLSGEKLPRERDIFKQLRLPREKGRMRFHRLHNVQIALDFLRLRQIKLVNIRSDDIADGNPKLTLGLIWTIILHFQIADIQVSGQSEDMTAKDRLLLWSQRMVEGYPGIRCDNFTTSWRDGRLFNAIIHRHRPELIDMKRVAVRANRENLEQAFTVAERDMGVTRLLDPEDVDVPSPDEKSIITYVSSLYDVIPRMPEVNSGLNANEVELRWTEYQEIVVIIMQWIRQYIIMFQTRANSANPTDLRAQYNQLVHFREVELPAKEAERLRMKSLFMMMENLIQSGHIKMPVGYHPSDMDKEWNKMLLTMSERERELKIEIDRLDMLQRVAGKIQKDALVCEDRLNQSSSMLQMDIRALENHRAPQHEADIERALNECDAMIRELFIDVQTLKDGRFFQAELMYRRVFQLHERFVSIRSEYKTTVGAANVGSEVISVKVPTIQVTSPRPQDDSNMKYVRDLLAWVEEHQAQIEKAEWGPDLPSVEGNLETHREFNRTIEDFRSSINEAKAGESKISPANRGNYADYFGRLELQYTRLLNMSRSRLRHLESLHAFVVRATKELMWLNDREEEEVNYDWSERNHNMSTKKEQHAVLMKELEQKESIINGIQDSGEQLLASNHPARQTIESYLAAMQTQWNWILQICCCIETHIKENTAYFQFFKEAKDVEEGLKSLQETIRRKYTCDKASSLTRLEDIVQDSMDEKEQLLEYKRLVSGLVSRAKTIVQLKPRSPENRVWSTLPVKAICDFKQQEITIYKNDECVMEDNAQCTKWKIINPIGNEALVPSVCFLIAPPNKDAIELATRMDQSYQNSMTLWHQLHVNMKSVISYLYLTKDIECIRSWTVTTFKTMPPDQYESVMKNLEVHYEDFLEDSRDSQLFSSTDRMTLERDMSSCKQYFDQLLITLERDERDESICSTLLVQLQAIRRRLEASEDRMIRNIRSPLEQPDPVQESSQRIMEHEKLHQDLEDVKVDLSRVVTECSEVLAQGNQSGSSPMLSSELNHTTQKMDQLHSLSTIYLERLKNIDAVVRSSQGAETIVRTFENRLCEDDTLPTDVQGIEAYKTQLKQWRSEVEQKKAVFFAMEDELQRARSVNERMLRSHGERDVDLDQQRHKVEQLLERWAGVQTQIDYRLRELDNLAKLLRSYREGSGWLLTWVDDTLKLQEKLQATKIEDVRGLEEQLEREKNLANDIEKNQIKVDESQKSSDQYHSAAKEYEMHLLIYKATADTHGGLKSPIKRRRLVSTSDSVLQEYMTLRTRYTALVTMTSQYVKFLNETLKRLQDEQKRSEKVTQQQAEHTQREVDTAIFRLTEIQVELERQRQLSDVYAQEKVQAEREADKLRHIVQEEAEKRRNTVEAAAVQKQAIEQEMVELKNRSESEVRRQATLVEEVLTQRRQIEEEIRVIRVEFERTARQKADAEGELARLRALAEEAAKQRQHAEQEAARYRSLAEEEASKKKLAEEELQKKVAAEQTAANQKRQALLEVERLKKMAEEAQKKKDQAEEEAKKQIRLAKEVAQQSIEVEIQARRVSFVEKVNELEQSRQQEHTMMTALQEESQRRKKMVEDAERARQAAEMELEKWRQKADEALRLKLQAEKQAQQKSLALEEAEKQKSEAERETSRRTQSQESTLRQKVMAEEELERQRAIAEETSQQKLQAEQELIRLRAIMADSEQQKSLLDEELMRLKAEVAEAVRQKKVLEEELAKVRAQMEELIRLKHRTEEENKKKSKEEKEKTQKIMEEEALKMKELAEEAARLRATADEAMRQRHLAEEEATHQRAEAERILKEKLNAIQETSKLKAEAEITLKERERENERLKRLAEEEAHQRRMLQEQATQQKQAIEEEMARIRQQSDLEMQRQKALVDETIIQRRLIEEEIHILKIEFEKASKGKLDLEGELKRLKIMADETTRLKENAEEEANKQKKIAMDETMRKKEAQEEVSRKTVAEQQAAQQWKAAMEELEKLKRKADEAMMLKQKAEDEAARQVKLAHEAAQTRINAEEMARQAALAEKDAEMKKLRQREEKTVEQLRLEADRTRKAAEQAEKARIAAEKEASMIRQQAEEALVLKLRAEQQAELKARLQEEAEKHRREAEHEAGKRTQAEEAALRLKALAEAEAERQKRIAVETQKQKSMAEQELTRLRTILEDSDHQKSILEEELMRMKGEVAEAIRQKGLVEEELARLKAQMEELLRLKAQNEMDNRKRAANDSENMKKMLEEEAAKMKQLAEEAARLRTNSDESARLRKQAEEELAQQRALAERLAREKLQAIQEASQLRAEAQAVQRQFDQAQERAKKLSEDRTEIQKKLEVETQTFQRTLEQERQRQHEVNIEAERLRMLVSELTKERARAQEESISLKSQMDEINSKRVSAERHAQEKIQLLQKMDVQKSQTDNEASRLRATISELERERERLKKEAEKAHTEAHEQQVRMQTELKEQEAQLCRVNETEARKQKATSDQEVSHLKTQLEDQEKQKGLISQQVNQMKAALTKAQQEKLATEKTLEGLMVKSKSEEAARVKLESQVREMSAQNQKVQAELKKSLRDAEQEVQRQRQQAEELLRQKNRIEEQWSSATTSMQQDAIARQTKAVEEKNMRTSIEKHTRQKEADDRMISTLKQQLEMTADLKRGLEKAVLETKMQIEGTLKEKAECDRKCKLHKEQIDSLTARLQKALLLNQEKGKMEQEAVKLRDELDKLKLDHDQELMRVKLEAQQQALKQEANLKQNLERKDLELKYGLEEKKTLAQELKIVTGKLETLEKTKAQTEKTMVEQRNKAEKAEWEKATMATDAAKQKTLIEQLKVQAQRVEVEMKARQVAEREGARKCAELEQEIARLQEGAKEAERRQKSAVGQEASSRQQWQQEMEAKLHRKDSQLKELGAQRDTAQRAYEEAMGLKRDTEVELERQRRRIQEDETKWEALRMEAFGANRVAEEKDAENKRLLDEVSKQKLAVETVKREETEITHKIEIMQKQLKEDSVKYQRERESMLQKQRILDEEKARLERTLETELGKARSQLEAEARMRKQQEEENARLRAQMEETLRKQKLYEDEFQRRQREALDLEKTRSDEEKKRAEQENKELLRKLKSLEEETKRQNEQKKLELEKLEQERKLEIQRLEEQRRIELQRIEEQKKIEMQALIEKTNATQTNGEIEVDKAKTNGTSSGSSTIETTYIYSEIETQKEFKNTMMDIPCGQFSGKQMSVWEVLYNTSLINENKRNELLSQYRTGKVTIKRIIIIIIEIITRITSFSFDGLRRKVTLQELMSSGLITQKTANDLESGTTSVEEVSHSIRNYLDGFIGIAGLYIEATKEKLSIYSAIKRGLLRPGTGLVLLEAQAATGFIVDPVRNLKFSVDEAAQKALVGQEYRDKLLSAERAVTGYKDPYSGKTISLFQAMKKGLILKDHGIRLLEAQIATGGIIDPQASHRLPVEVAYKRGLFDKEMNQILLDPSDDTKGFFDPNTEENLTYLDLMQRCITDADTGLCLLPLKEKKKERKMSSKSSVRKRRVIIIDPDTNRELTVSEAYRKGLIDHETYVQLSGQECEWEEIVTTGSDGVVTSVLVDRRSGRQYSVEEAIAKGSLDPSAIEMYRSGQLSITDFGDLLTGNQSSKSTSSIQSKSSSFPMSPLLSPDSTDSIWSDPTEESSAIGGILDTQKLEKISVAEAMRRKLVDNFTGQRLVEAQACTGGILDPFSGKRYTIKAAVTEGLIDSRIGQMISASEKAFIGFEDPITKAKLGILPAMNKGLLTYESGRRYLEAQYLTGGMVEPGNPKRLTLEEALPKGLVDQSNMKKLRDVATHFKYLTCPKTRARMSYKDALDRSMVDADNGIRLLEASGVISSSGGLGSAYGSLTSSKASSRQGSRRGSIDLGSGSGSSFGGLGSSGYSSTSYNSMSYSGMGSGGFSSGSYTQRRY